MNPEQQKQFAKDEVKKRLGPLPSVSQPTADEKLMRMSIGIFNHVTNTTLKPLLESITTPAAYNKLGTQKLLLDAFEREFKVMSKEELIRLVSIMHMEELEKQAAQMAEAGLIGDHINK